MENENEITDKTYTLNSVDSFFDDASMSLKILLPEEDDKNPYEYTAFDLTQTIDNNIVNAVLVFMRKSDDNGDDLSGSDNDINEVNHTCELKNLEKLSDLPGLGTFDIANNDTLVIVCHDTNNDMPKMILRAEKVYEMIPVIRTNVATNGNFQSELNFSIGGTPKKTGMSSVPKR